MFGGCFNDEKKNNQVKTIDLGSSLSITKDCTSLSASLKKVESF